MSSRIVDVDSRPSILTTSGIGGMGMIGSRESSLRFPIDNADRDHLYEEFAPLIRSLTRRFATASDGGTGVGRPSRTASANRSASAA